MLTTVTGHIHDTFRKLTVKNCVVVKLIQVVQRLKLDRRYHKPFVFQSVSYTHLEIGDPERGRFIQKVEERHFVRQRETPGRNGKH